MYVSYTWVRNDSINYICYDGEPILVIKHHNVCYKGPALLSLKCNSLGVGLTGLVKLKLH